jgi:hypothetical protein
MERTAEQLILQCARFTSSIGHATPDHIGGTPFCDGFQLAQRGVKQTAAVDSGEGISCVMSLEYGVATLLRRLLLCDFRV